MGRRTSYNFHWNDDWGESCRENGLEAGFLVDARPEDVVRGGGGGVFLLLGFGYVCGCVVCVQ